MDERGVLKAACAMPLTNPSYPPGPYRFIDREYMIIVYRTDIDALHRVVPEPLEVIEPIVKYEFIRMPNSTATTPSRVRSSRYDFAARWAATSTSCF